MLAAEPVVGKMHLPSPQPASLFADWEIHSPFAALAPSSAVASMRDDEFKRDLVVLLNLRAMVQYRPINLSPLPLVVGDSSVHEVLDGRYRHTAQPSETNCDRLRDRIELRYCFIHIAAKFAQQFRKVADRVGQEGGNILEVEAIFSALPLHRLRLLF